MDGGKDGERRDQRGRRVGESKERQGRFHKVMSQ